MHNASMFGGGIAIMDDLTVEDAQLSRLFGDIR